MIETPASTAASLARALLALRNADGGWGASGGAPSNVEATALALLALGPGGAPTAAHWLARTQRRDGAWSYLEKVDQPSWATSVAVLALLDAGRRDAAGAGARWLVGSEPQPLPWRMRLRYWLAPEAQAVELDPELEGWPWVPGAFGWVEPTAFAMLAVRAAGAGRRARGRVRDGAGMLLDRMCTGGGWNYGNRRVLDTDLEPYPDTTAIALLALHGVAPADRLTSSLSLLEPLLGDHASGLALGLAALCFQRFGQDASAAIHRMQQRWERTRFLDDVRSLAVARIALEPGRAAALYGKPATGAGS